VPINIYINEKLRTSLAYLCKEDWTLPGQVSELEQWINMNASKFNGKEIVADIGFSVRKDASGGGAVLSPELMHKLSKSNVWVYLSEYILEE
jgi:hypothetical protein